jgi:hypothetical protein
VNQQLRVGQGCHQGASTSGVVEVDMGWNNIAHLFRRNVPLVEQLPEDTSAVTGSRFQHCTLPPLLHQVEAGHAMRDVSGINAGDTVP